MKCATVYDDIRQDPWTGLWMYSHSGIAQPNVRGNIVKLIGTVHWGTYRVHFSYIFWCFQSMAKQTQNSTLCKWAELQNKMAANIFFSVFLLTVPLGHLFTAGIRRHDTDADCLWWPYTYNDCQPYAHPIPDMLPIHMHTQFSWACMCFQ